MRRDPRKWLTLPWIDQYSGKQYRISTTLATGTKQIARVKSYGDVLEEYEFHGGQVRRCQRRAVRQANRGAVTAPACERSSPPPLSAKSRISLKRSSRAVAGAGDVFTEYPDPRRDEWTASIWPWLKSRTVPEVMELTGYPRKTIQRWRQGQRPSTKSLARLSAMLRRGDSK